MLAEENGPALNIHDRALRSEFFAWTPHEIPSQRNVIRGAQPKMYTTNCFVVHRGGFRWRYCSHLGVLAITSYLDPTEDAMVR